MDRSSDTLHENSSFPLLSCVCIKPLKKYAVIEEIYSEVILGISVNMEKGQMERGAVITS